MNCVINYVIKYVINYLIFNLLNLNMKTGIK